MSPADAALKIVGLALAKLKIQQSVTLISFDAHEDGKGGQGYVGPWNLPISVQHVGQSGEIWRVNFSTDWPPDPPDPEVFSVNLDGGVSDELARAIDSMIAIP